ncbi:TrmB family transcriptional regulator [Micropruina sp.]|uniref:TrmB family transcriptional regulator n=1 Tax=Micropruina sp. TaxID=2737536 RepID=UPI0039E5C37E
MNQQAFGETEIQALRAIGLTEWESKAYLALLDEAPDTGYGIAKRSGVARGRVYEVLDSLVAKGAARVSNGKPQKYAPTTPEEFLKVHRRQTEDSLSHADEVLRNFGSRDESGSVIWDLQGRGDILNRAQDVINRASKRLLCEIWEAEADRLYSDLERAAARGVKVIVVAYGSVELPFATVFLHPGTDEVTHGLGSRWLVISADDREIVAGSVSGGTESRAAWTKHHGLVVPVTELVRHDLYKLEMLKAHGDILEETFGPALTKLRAKYGPLA